MRRLAERGDTIIELVIAFAIFSLAAVGTLAIINKGVATTQRNLEVTLVRQQVDSQAELVRYIHDTNKALWASLIAPANLVTNPQPVGTTDAVCPESVPANSFYIRPTAADTFTRQAASSATFTGTPTTHARIDYATLNSTSQGIWMQAARVDDTSGRGVDAYDFYIHACWMSVGVDTPMTVGTIVRLYEQ